MWKRRNAGLGVAIRNVIAVILCALALAACRSHCPQTGPVGVLRPIPVQPITTPYAPAPVASEVSVVDISLYDTDRKRSVPIRVYAPAAGDRLPLILFSHGLGSSRKGYAYLGNAWAGRGFIVIHVQHIDSDKSLSLFRLYKASYAPEVWKDRPRDISFVLDMLERKGPSLGAVWKRADLTRVGVGGHSYGAQTALHVAGVLTDFRKGESDVSFADDRVDAIVALSVPFMPGSADPSSFRPVHVPVLHMTGTADQSPAFDTEICHKRLPFDWISGPPQYLVTMEGAVHRSFAGESEAGGPEIEHYHQMIVELTSAFWDATLRDDPSAREWLDRAAPARAKIERK